jgi:CHAT domain-containing protein
MDQRLSSELLNQLAALAPAEADALLAEQTPRTAGVIAHLADAALAFADRNAAAATAWLALAERTAEQIPVDDGTAGLLLYAQARLALVAGEMATAEQFLAAARARWQEAGDTLMLARSGLGLTQILAMQGRYAEAEPLIRQSLAIFSAAGDDYTMQALAARQNLATLLTYREAHADALAENDQLLAALAARYAELDLAVSAPETDADSNDGDRAALAADRAAVAGDLGRVQMGRALSLTYLEQPLPAETALQEAIARFDGLGETVDRGRARTNLATLHLRTGRFGTALAHVREAAGDLLGSDDEAPPEADVLLLEQATVYLALNLLAEAAAAATEAIAHFRRSEQRYELAQSLYTLALIQLRQGDRNAAVQALAETDELFTALDNRLWLRRTVLGRAALLLDDENPAGARMLLAPLVPEETGEADRLMAVEAQLLLARAGLALADEAGTAAALDQAEGQLTALGGLYPHLRQQATYLRGQLARRRGDWGEARRLYYAAIAQIEESRAALPVEEIRTAFLNDKMAVYAELVVALLDDPAAGDAEVVAAFDVIERARSRALLEHLLAALPPAPAITPAPEGGEARADGLRRQLHWLYNRLLGDGDGASRSALPELTEAIRHTEQALRTLAWQQDALPAAVQPVTLADLQSLLEADEHAVVYFLAGAEWMAFVVDRTNVRVHRRLGTAEGVDAALAELRFQLGRVEIGEAYLSRHMPRLQRSVEDALHRLHQLLWEPLAAGLTGEKTLVIPFGALHLAPFHAFWDGERYVLEAREIAYAASASVATDCRRRRRDKVTPTAIAAFAVPDPGIPQAEIEVITASNRFADAEIFLGEAATRSALALAAERVQVVHVATHGLFRADNPFFSALRLADGWLDVRDLYQMTVNAPLVVLSACQSGANEVQGGDEVIGLARGFLAAGATALLVSLWNVHDASAAGLMDDFYRALTERPRLAPAAALRSAQRVAAQQRRHPYFWAPYIAVG